MREELTDSENIRHLAGHSWAFKQGLKQLLESGYDEDELSSLIDEAEAELAEQEKARTKRIRRKKLVSNF